MATNAYLRPELEQFARACVTGGRYNNVSEVVRAGLRLLQDVEERRLTLARMLAAAEADRAGDVALEDALAEMDLVIANAARWRRPGDGGAVTAAALRDLRSAVEWIAGENPAAAAALRDAVARAGALIGAHPLVGRERGKIGRAHV